jgi:hypothetical protein
MSGATIGNKLLTLVLSVIGFRLQDKVPGVAVFPDAPEDVLPVIVLADPLQASLHEALDVSRIQVQFEVEDLTVIAVIVPDSRPTREDLSTPSPPSFAR